MSQNKIKVLSKSYCDTAIYLIILTIFISLISVFTKQDKIQDNVYSIIDTIIEIGIFYILSKYFKKYKEKSIVVFIDIMIAINILFIIILTVYTILLLGYNPNADIIVGVMGLLFLPLLLIIGIILFVKLLRFEHDASKYIKKYAITSIISYMLIIIYLALDDNDIIDKITTLIDIIPYIFLLLFFRYLIGNDCSFQVIEQKDFNIDEQNKSTQQENIPELLKKISELKERGIITEEEFEEKKKNLLKKI